MKRRRALAARHVLVSLNCLDRAEARLVRRDCGKGLMLRVIAFFPLSITAASLNRSLDS